MPGRGACGPGPPRSDARSRDIAGRVGDLARPALADVGGRTALTAAGQLEERRLSAVMAWAEISRELGSHGVVADELSAELDRYPLCEPLAGLLMLALYRAGRAAESLVCYQRIRHTIAEDLGVDPGPELQSQYHRILAADPALNHRSEALQRNYLPRDIRAFYRPPGRTGPADVHCGQWRRDCDPGYRRDVGGRQDGHRGARGTPVRGALR